MAARLTSLGIRKIEALHYYVRDLERTRRFFVDELDFAELGGSGPELEREGAWRYLRKHPEGVGTVVIAVEDLDQAFRLLDERGATFITDVQRFEDDGGTLKMVSITTPFGDTTFRFVERRGFRGLYPGFVPGAGARAANNRFGFQRIDHITSNFQTM